MLTPGKVASAPAVVDGLNTPYSQERQYASSFAEMWAAGGVSRMPSSTQTFNLHGKPSDSDSD